MGTVSADVALRDLKTGAEVHSQSYTGHYNEKSLGGMDETWERVMNKALDRMVQQASTDPRLIQVLKALHNTQEPKEAISAESRQ